MLGHKEAGVCLNPQTAWRVILQDERRYTHMYTDVHVGRQRLRRPCPFASLLKALAGSRTTHFWVKTQDCSVFFSTVADETKILK